METTYEVRYRPNSGISFTVYRIFGTIEEAVKEACRIAELENRTIDKYIINKITHETIEIE